MPRKRSVIEEVTGNDFWPVEDCTRKGFKFRHPIQGCKWLQLSQTRHFASLGHPHTLSTSTSISTPHPLSPSHFTNNTRTVSYNASHVETTHLTKHFNYNAFYLQRISSTTLINTDTKLNRASHTHQPTSAQCPFTARSRPFIPPPPAPLKKY